LAGAILSKAGLTDVFSSLLFLLPVGYVAASMTVCSLTSLTNLLRRAKRPVALLDGSKYEKKQYYKEFSLATVEAPGADALTGRVVRVIGKSRYTIVDRFSEQDVHCIAAHKGVIGIFGPFLMHLHANRHPIIQTAGNHSSIID
jgi:cytochrome c biogenesis protein ResB